MKTIKFCKVEYTDAKTICHIEDDDQTSLKLILAAPELLEALMQARGLIVRLCNDVKNNYGLDLDVNTLLRVRGIDDAIDKARGES